MLTGSYPFPFTKAQQKTILTGIVSSEKGDMLAGAGVSIVNAATQEKQTVITNEKAYLPYRAW